MGKIPNGTAPHILFEMDGRTWIENSYAAGPYVERLIERGRAVRIPQELIEELVKKVREGK